LHRAQRDENADAAGAPADHGRDNEEHYADQEHAAAAVQVAELARREQECREGQRIGVDHPLQLGDRDVEVAEVATDHRERDVDDSRIERRHQRARGDHRHRQTLPRLPAVGLLRVRGTGTGRFDRASPPSVDGRGHQYLITPKE
jgi:hypothetical protein